MGSYKTFFKQQNFKIKNLKSAKAKEERSVTESFCGYQVEGNIKYSEGLCQNWRSLFL